MFRIFLETIPIADDFETFLNAPQIQFQFKTLLVNAPLIQCQHNSKPSK